MKLRIAALVLATLSSTTMASDVKWQYKGEHGTKHWGELSSKFATCSSGVNQSPIDISGAIEAQLPNLSIDYQVGKVIVVNNGHTIQANIQDGSTFTNDDGKFDLKQFHFHSPSENTINGQSFPLEAHFVHADADGRLAVISVMFKEGQENRVLKQVWKNMPKHKGNKTELKKNILSSDLFPKSQDYYRFNGSLTTPPCSEGVRWFVMKAPVEASKAQINKFRDVMHGDTNRPVQPINARVILK